MIGWVTLLGGLAGLDRTAFGQTSLAHPAVAGILCALLVQSPLEGIRMAAIITVLASPSIPVGQIRPRDWTSAAIVGVALGSSLPTSGGWGAGLLWAVLWSRPGGWMIEMVRAVAGRAMVRADAARRRGDVRAMERLHLSLTSLHPLRGALVSLLALGSGLVILPPLLTSSAPLADALGRGWELAPWAAVPVLWRVHGGRGGWSWCVIGAASLAVVLAAGARWGP